MQEGFWRAPDPVPIHFAGTRAYRMMSAVRHGLPNSFNLAAAEGSIRFVWHIRLIELWCFSDCFSQKQDIILTLRSGLLYQ